MKYFTLRSTALVALVMLSASCTRPFVILARGHIERGVVFYFYGLTANTTAEFRVTEFIVQEQRGDQWLTVWQLNGKLLLDSIAYGAKYPGLKERQPPVSLSVSSDYPILAKEHPRFGGVDDGVGFFKVDDQGNVVTTGRE